MLREQLHDAYLDRLGYNSGVAALESTHHCQPKRGEWRRALRDGIHL
jgi:hypothetical protein